ncbi:MAG: pyruvoyl-dependent arginine decarboxylase [Nanoarchaeota archaeon]
MNLFDISKNKGTNTLYGNRIPKDFFITKGKGESEITIHAGSYHLALRDAGIEMCNIMTYSSILPKIANIVERPNRLVHGSVMETIMAVSNSNKGERATAAIIFGWLYDKKTNKKYGGLVCEYNGPKEEAKAITELKQSLNELYTNGYSEKYNLKNINIISQSLVPKKRYGTSIVALCFTNYIYPRIK